jgi:hypothetical protein
MRSDWLESSRHRLLELQRADGAWSYKPGTSPAVEPTAMAGLALLTKKQDEKAARSAAKWLESSARGNGSVVSRSVLPDSTWGTPFAKLLWSAVGGFETRRSAAVEWLLKQAGEGFDKGKNSALGHDTTLVGWPWISGTHSWVEPTSIALLALGREGEHARMRCQEAVRLILDRAIPSGGWNYGNNLVFDTELRPQPAPTGLALLALSRFGVSHPSVSLGLAYLEKTLATTRAPISLGWGLLALRAWGRTPLNSAEWLAEAAETSRIRDDVVGLSLILMAADDRSLELLGTPFEKKAVSDV